LIFLLFKFLKVWVCILFSLWAYYFTITHQQLIWEEIINLFLFPAVFLLINYALIKLVLWYIKYYNNLLVIHDGQLIIIETSLFFKNNIEFIDINKITKLDILCKWVIPNLLSYWTLLVEQQSNVVKDFIYISEPFIALQLINEEKQRTIKDRKKTYIVSKTNIE